MKIAKLNIEGYIGGGDMISLFGGEPTFNLSALKKFLDALEPDVTDIHVYINSGGGSVVEGWAIYDKLKVSGKTITTIGEGIVGSIATIIYMAGTTRKLHENSRFFIHNPYWQPDAPVPMEGEQLINLGNDLKAEQQKILDFYANQTGTSIDSIEPLMQKATDLTSVQAVEMGFATEIITSSVNYHPYKLVAYVDAKKEEKQINNKQMDKKENNSWIKRNFTKLAALINGVTLNMEMPVKDGNGNDVTLYIESETEDLTGKPAFLVDADGNQEVAPNGDYVDANGKTIKVIDGMVSEVVEAQAAAPADDENTPTIEELTAQLAAMTEANATLTTELENAKAEAVKFEAFKTEFENLKKVVIGEGQKFDQSKQNFKKEESQNVGSAYAQAMADRIRKSK